MEARSGSLALLRFSVLMPSSQRTEQSVGRGAVICRETYLPHLRPLFAADWDSDPGPSCTVHVQAVSVPEGRFLVLD